MIRKLLMICFTWLAFAFGADETSLFAQGGGGYRVTYHDVWPSSSEMKYVRATITPVSGVATKDIDFHVVARFNQMKFSTVVSLRKGDASAIGELYAQSGGSYRFSLHTETDGDLTENRGDFAMYSYSNYNANANNDQTPAVVFASSEVKTDQTVSYIGLSKTVNFRQQFPVQVAFSPQFPDLTKVGETYELASGGSTMVAGGRSPLDLNGVESPEFAAVSLGVLPSRWFGYEGLDMLILTLDDLKLLTTEYPSKFLALQRWVAAAGRLVVINCGDKLEKADEALIQFGEKFLRESSDQVIYPPNELRELRLAPVNNDLLNRAESLSQRGGEEANFGLMAVPFHRGMIICVSDEGSDWGLSKQKKVNRWRNLLDFNNALNGTGRMFQKQGVMFENTLPTLGFPEFAEPPRYLFESSILLYLIAVGPLAFFLLKQRNQLNLLFVLIPAFSLLCCFTILMYAIFAEGFDTRVNVVTVSELDQQNGRLSTDSISHVYAGISPGSYRFDGSSYGLVNSSYRNQRQLTIKQQSNSQEISGGEIRARTNHQVFMRSSSESTVGLRIVVEDRDGEKVARVRNGFSSRLQLAIFSTEDCGRDEVWLLQNVAAGEVATAKKSKLDDVSSEVRGLVREQMQPTILIAGGSSDSSRSTRRNYSRRIFSQNQRQPLDVDDSVCAQSLTRLKMASKAWLRSQTDRSDGRGYVAVVDACENFELPVPDATVEGSLHVIYGAW